MRFARTVFVPLPLLLSGCISKDEKIVDLAGGVFLIFLVLIGVKYGTRRFADTRVFSQISSFLNRHAGFTVYPVYFLALGLCLIGILYEGIHRIQVLSGLVLAIIGFNLRRLSIVEDNGLRKFHAEVISLGISILLVLSLLWGLGADLFREF